MDKLIKKINTSPLIRRRVISGDSMQCFPKIFGISLKNLIEKEEFAKVPRIVINICEFLLINGLETEGIFRVNGNNKAVESIKLLFEENYSLNMSNCTDVYAVASVLKLFIRELPEGLIPENVAIQFVEIYKRNLNNSEICIDEFRTVLTCLPEENFNLLKYLCQFLTKIAEKENVNKMNSLNLGIVFGPNIFRCSHNIEGLKLQSDMNNIMSCFIIHFNFLFKYNNTCHQNENVGTSYFGIEGSQIPQIVSIEGHKSSSSLSGDFDLSSSNDNQMYPAPLPTSISSNLQQAISNCINNHLSEDFVVPLPKLLDVPINNDHQMIRTTSVPQGISKYSVDVNNEFTDISNKSSTEINTQSRSNISSSVPSKLIKPVTYSNRKPLLVTQESWNDIIHQNDVIDFNYLNNKSTNTAMIDEMLSDWQGQDNLIDLDDLDDNDMLNDTKENSIQRTVLKAEIPNTLDSAKRCENHLLIDRSSNINEIQVNIKHLRKKIREFKDNFERQHGCKPQNIEKTGNSQVQEWLTELVHLREKLNICQSDNNADCISGDYMVVGRSNKLNNEDVNMKNTSQLQSGASTFSGVSEQVETAHKQKVISSLENINVQNMTVVQYLDYLNSAINGQRKRAARPESMSDMTKEQLEEEKMDLQKCLLYFEKNYGRPRENHVKHIMKPLYDRYRYVKRLIKAPENESKFSPSSVNPQLNEEHGDTIASSRSRGHSCVKFSDEDLMGVSGKPKKEFPTLNIESNNQMSQSFTAGNESRFKYWSQSPSSGSWKSGVINMSQENMNTYFISQNSNIAHNLLLPESLSQKHGSVSNFKLKYQSSSVPLPVDISNSSATVAFKTPIHSVYSTKSFNSSVVDTTSFRQCNTMSKTEIETEKEVLLIEKRRLQKLLKDFEHGLEKITGHRVEKSDRDHMRAEYDRYKSIKCRLRILEKEMQKY